MAEVHAGILELKHRERVRVETHAAPHPQVRAPQPYCGEGDGGGLVVQVGEGLDAAVGDGVFSCGGVEAPAIQTRRPIGRSRGGVGGRRAGR